MRLTELTGIKHLNKKKPSEIMSTLGGYNKEQKTKLKFLGGGANAVALTDGVNVFKFWHEDSAYEKFMGYCLANQDNPFVPKLKSRIRKLPITLAAATGDSLFEGVKYVKMERLVPLTDDNTVQVFKDGVVDDNVNHVEFVKLMYDLSTGEMNYPQHAIEFLTSRFVPFQRAKDKITVDSLSDEFKYLIKVMKAIHGFDGTDTSLDFHRGNIMARDNGQVVIIDPLVSNDDLEINSKILKIEYAEDYWKSGYSHAEAPKTPEQKAKLAKEMDDIFAELWD